MLSAVEAQVSQVGEYLESEYPKFEETFEDLYSLSISSNELEDSILNLENELNLFSTKTLSDPRLETLEKDFLEKDFLKEEKEEKEEKDILKEVQSPVKDDVSMEILKFKKEILLEKQKELEHLQKEFQIQLQNFNLEILELKKESSLKAQENLELTRENSVFYKVKEKLEKQVQDLKEKNSEIPGLTSSLEIANNSLKEKELEILKEKEQLRAKFDKEKEKWEQDKLKEIKEIKEKLSKSCTDVYSSSISRVQSHLEEEKKSLLEDFEQEKQVLKVSITRAKRELL